MSLIPKRVLKWYADLRRTEHIFMVLVALVIGLLGGLCAVGFRMLIEAGQLLAWTKNTNLVEFIRDLPWWWKISVPAVGGLLVGLITYYFAREAKGHGVPEVMEAVALRGSRIRPRVVVAKMVASGICIATGGSVGREGPIVQIGSSLGSSIGQWLKIGEHRLRTLVGCGAAAGIAATFNAPVAGAIFALEIILSDFRVSRFSPIVISSVMATVVSRYLLGDVPAFEVPAYTLESPAELLAYAILGIAGGVVAIAFVRSLYKFEDLFDAVPIYPPVKALIGGAIIGSIALVFPEILGVGYESINAALSGSMVLWLLLVLVVVKIIAVSVTIGSGGSGGIFAPSLFIGAMVGGVIGVFVNDTWPGSVASPGAYALVGMAAVVGATTHAPITAILIVFELTSDYKIILPLMVSCIIATIIAMRIQKASIYTMKLLRRGVDIHKGRSVNVLEKLHVKDVMRTDFAATPQNTSLVSIISRFMEKPRNSLFVVDKNNRLCGLITLDDVRPVITQAGMMDDLLIAKDLMRDQGFPVFHPNDSLAEVMRQLTGHVHEAPVLRDGEIVGSIWPDDVISRYNSEIFKRDTAVGLASSMEGSKLTAEIPGIRNMKLAEIPVPYRFVGKSIGELNVRQRFGISILMLKRKVEGSEGLVDTVPSAGTVLSDDDVVLAMGTSENLDRFEKG